MGDIVKELEIEGDKGKARIQVVFDAGAAQPLIKRGKVEGIATLITLPHPLTFTLGDGEGPALSPVEATLIAQESVLLFVTMDGITINDQVLVVDKLSEDMIIGARTMQGWRIRLDLERKEVVRKERCCTYLGRKSCPQALS